MSEQHHHPKPSESSHRHGAVRVSEQKKLLAVTVITGVTMVAEFIGGILTNSLALLGDAFHMLTHFGAVGMSYLAIRIALRPAPPDKTYRYWRAEVIASFINGMTLLPIAGYVIYEAYQRWMRPPEEIKVLPMLGVATIGLLVNIVSAACLHSHAKEDLNVRGAFLHMVSDTASSVGVILAGVAIYFFKWTQADPLIAALISVMIVVWSISLMRESIGILLESVPKHMNVEEIRARLKTEEGVAEVHDLHVWTITSKMHALTAHVILKEDVAVSKTEDLAHRLQHLLDGEFDINHVTLQFETNHKVEHCAHDHVPTHEHSHPHTH